MNHQFAKLALNWDPQENNHSFDIMFGGAQDDVSQCKMGHKPAAKYIGVGSTHLSSCVANCRSISCFGLVTMGIIAIGL